MHVGMNRVDGGGGRGDTRVPHARGDEPMTLAADMVRDLSSPCTWG